MECDKITVYRDIAFCSKTPKQDSYQYLSVGELVTKSKMLKENSFKCRTVANFESIDGRFYITDIKITSTDIDVKLRVSTRYLKNSLQTSVLPYPVQIFGILQWQKEPILYAKVLQVMPTKTAIMTRDIFNNTKQFVASEAL